MNTFVSNECAASMREIKNRQGKEELVNICIPFIIYFFSHAEFAGEVLKRGRFYKECFQLHCYVQQYEKTGFFFLLSCCLFVTL